MQKQVELIEVSPRDGIQNENTLLTLEQKLKLIQYAVDSGAARVEVTSFVNPKRVPQMADADDICNALPSAPQCQFIGLALNKRGFERASHTNLDEINFVVVASDTFSLRNQGTNTADGIALFNKLALDSDTSKKLGVTIAASFGCPFEGEMSIDRLLHVVDGCMKSEPFELALADTIGVATPKDIKERIKAVKQRFPDVPIRLHLHNTRNTGIANAWAGLEAGISALDASFGGVGGCPFAPAATGNIATEDLLYMLDRAGVASGVNLDTAIEAAQFVEQVLGKTVPGMVMKAGRFP